MQVGPGQHHAHVTPTRGISRRTMVRLTAKLAGGAVLTVIAGDRLSRIAAAQDEEIILTAAASEVGARPGSAYAQGYAALAAADQDTGATAVAATSAPPDGGTGGASVGVVPGSSGRCRRC